jgi:hypothetical protein
MPPHSCLRYHSDDFLFDSALDAVDEALGSAAGVKKKTSKEVDQAFKNAIKVLELYEEDFHPERMVDEKRTVNGSMAAAKAEDIVFSANSGFFKELFSPKVRLVRIQPLHRI